MDATKITLPIFKVPVLLYEFLDCGEAGTAQGAREHVFLVEARDTQEAIGKLESNWAFWENYNALSNEKRKNLKPFRINEDRAVERILECELRHKNIREEYTCGMPIHSIGGHPDKNNESMNNNGEFGFCCIEGYDIPDNCPYSKLVKSVCAA